MECSRAGYGRGSQPAQHGGAREPLQPVAVQALGLMSRSSPQPARPTPAAGITVGSAVALRDVREGSVYFAWPDRVVDVRSDTLLLARRPGATGMVVKGYPTDPKTVRAEITKPSPELVELVWARTVTLGICKEAHGWYTRLFWDAETGVFLGYYIDFVRPIVFNGACIDTLDLALDVVVTPDLRWSFKDEDDYAMLRERGWITPEDHQAVNANRPRVLREIETGSFPFDGSLAEWRWPAQLSLADLPDGWDH